MNFVFSLDDRNIPTVIYLSVLLLFNEYVSGKNTFSRDTDDLSSWSSRSSFNSGGVGGGGGDVDDDECDERSDPILSLRARGIIATEQSMSTATTYTSTFDVGEGKS